MAEKCDPAQFCDSPGSMSDANSISGIPSQVVKEFVGSSIVAERVREILE